MKVEREKPAIEPSVSVAVWEFAPEKDQIELIAGFLKRKQETSSHGVIVSSNRPVANLIEKLKDYGYNLEDDMKRGQVVVVDLLSKNVGAPEMARVIYVSSVAELSALQLAIERALIGIKGSDEPKWLLLDSIVTLLVFNTPEALLGFIHFLVGRLRVLKIDSVLFAVQGGIDVRTISTIKQMADRTVKL